MKLGIKHSFLLKTLFKSSKIFEGHLKMSSRAKYRLAIPILTNVLLDFFRVPALVHDHVNVVERRVGSENEKKRLTKW
jgi:hypothetical protein